MRFMGCRSIRNWSRIVAVMRGLLLNYRARVRTHLEVREGFVREYQTTAEEYTGRQISGVREGRDQRNGSHLPVVREYSRAHEQPTVERCQVAEGEQSETNDSTTA